MYLPDNSLLHEGKYKIVRHISSGGFGKTYEGVHVLMNSKVAIKEFFPKSFCNRDEDTSAVTVATQSNRQLVEKLRKKFIEEAIAIFHMNHPNIVKVHDVFEDNGTAYYVMDFIDGRSLGEMVRQGPLPEPEAVGYIRQVANALEYVHEFNRLHLDVKPGNIMVDAEGKAILIDFGASKHYDMESGENTSTLMGVNTKGYAPVEQSTRSFTNFSPATDIYALGATLYKLLTGVTPPDAQLLLAKEEVLQPLPTTVTPATRNAVLAAMTPIRAERPQSIREFLALLDGSVATNDEPTVCEEEEKRRMEEEKRKRAEEELRKAEEEKRKRAEEAQRAARAAEEARLKAKNEKKKRIIGIAAAGVVIAILAFIGYRGIDTSLLSAQDSLATYSANGVSFNLNGVSFDLCLVKGGTFRMGSDDAEAYTVHTVTVSDYYIGKTEVTQELWKAVMGENPSYWEGDNLPVEQVSWEDCQTFIRKLNGLTGKTFRLPTEAEWEFAARGGNNSQGFKYSGSDNIDEVAWFDDNSNNQTHPVGTKMSNELGIYDMSGNVWEWCEDWVDNIGSGRVFRGSSWEDDAWLCRSLGRGSGGAPEYRYFNIGLRLVLVP